MPDEKPSVPPPTDSANRPPSRSGPRGRPTGDGRKDPGQQKRNQEHLGVGDDHRTPEMKKNHRGTFP